MCFFSITTGFLRPVPRLGGAGLLLIASLTFAGNGSPVIRPRVSVHEITAHSALLRGANSFVVSLADHAQDRSFTFVNEDAAAEGRLVIAVSNELLALDSPKWSSVEGSIRFRHKRLFMVSLVGVEANYVKLTFLSGAPNAGASISGLLQEILTTEKASATAMLQP